MLFLQNPPAAGLKYNAHELEIGGMFGAAWQSLSRDLNYT
jgi:hypothetical protein